MVLTTRPILSMDQEKLEKAYYESEKEQHENIDEMISELLYEDMEYFEEQVDQFLYETGLYGVYYLHVGRREFLKYIEKLSDLHEYIEDREIYVNINVYLDRIEINDYITAYNTIFMEQDTLEMILYDEEIHTQWAEIEEDLYVEARR